MTALPYTRALHVDDYNTLAPWTNQLAFFEDRLRQLGVPYRKDHAHRDWEYANVLRQLTELRIPPGASIHDTGSGGSYFPPYLALQHYEVSVSDSLAYCPDLVPSTLIPQCVALGIQVPFYQAPVEDLASIENEAFDVTLCISVIEHVDASLFDAALAELCRVTKPGGYLFLTSDYFRDREQADQSPYRSIQHTAFTEDTVLGLGHLPMKFIGGMDLAYRGDFVHNYSFVNIALQKLTAAELAEPAMFGEP